LGLPLVLAFILILSVWIRKLGYRVSAVLGLLLGVMVMTNTWDFLNYGLLLGITGLAIFVGRPRLFGRLFRSGVIIGVVTGLVASQWWMGFESISKGIGLVKNRTPLWNFAVLWLGHLTIVALALWLNWKLKLKNKMLVTLAITALVLLVLPEIVYVKDIYTGHYRANTMFKLTYQAFIMMGLLGGVVVVNVFKVRSLVYKLLASIIFGIFFVGVMVYPSLAFKSYYGFKTYRCLDGLDWFKKRYPGQAVMVDYLESHRDNKNMLEAVGESYTEFDAISAFSGVPTIQGWQVHEWLWRGGWDKVGLRSGEVASVYQGQDIALARDILDKYNVGWIVIGANERKKYKLNTDLLYQLGNVVEKSFGVELIKVTEPL
jgi:uncharacterized membrane protein